VEPLSELAPCDRDRGGVGSHVNNLSTTGSEGLTQGVPTRARSTGQKDNIALKRELRRSKLQWRASDARLDGWDQVSVHNGPTLTMVSDTR
jgi:hypothetical protein